MNDFDKNLLDLLDECASLLTPEHDVSFEKIETLPSYKTCQQAFDQDSDFGNSIKWAGFWGTFSRIFNNIYQIYISIRKNKIVLNKIKAIERVSELRKVFSTQKLILLLMQDY